MRAYDADGLPVNLGKLQALNHAKRKLALALVSPVSRVGGAAGDRPGQDDDSGNVAAIFAGADTEQAGDRFGA
jgi:hypothetical protein